MVRHQGKATSPVPQKQKTLAVNEQIGCCTYALFPLQILPQLHGWSRNKWLEMSSFICVAFKDKDKYIFTQASSIEWLSFVCLLCITETLDFGLNLQYFIHFPGLKSEAGAEA